MHTVTPKRSPPAASVRRGRRRRLVLAGLAAGGVGAILGLVAARLIFERQIDGEVEAVLTAAQPPQPTALTEERVAALPPPVQRWLRFSGVVGGPLPRTVELRYDGDFRLSENQPWMPYQSETIYTLNPPALIWPVTMHMFRVLPIRGRDRYQNGTGAIRMKLMSLIPVADKQGGGLNQGALLRFLGETVWFPAAAAAPYITWSAADGDSAVATMTYGEVSATATFYFDGEGRVTKLTADRYNDVLGRLEPWSVPISAYGEFSNVRLPSAGDGVWHYESGDFSYIRWRLASVQYHP